jgi:hypothetical protein
VKRSLSGGVAAVVLGALAAAAMLGLAAPAGAADVPSQLDIFDYQGSTGRAAEVDLDLLLSSSAAPTAKVVYYVPPGFGVNTSLAAGTQIGTVNGTLLSGSASVPATGKAFVDNPANYLTQTCAPGTHVAVWVLKLTVVGQEVDVPIYVDPATPDISSMASYTLTACFANPTTLQGLQVGEADVDLTQGMTNPSATGSHLWRALVTPFDATGNPSATGTTELQAIVPLPQHLTVTTRYVKKTHTVVIAGSVLAAGHARVGVNVRFVSSPDASFSKLKTFGVARTNSKGHFSFSHRLTKTTYFGAYMNPYYAASCLATLGPAPCSTATISPPPPAFARVRVG